MRVGDDGLELKKKEFHKLEFDAVYVFLSSIGQIHLKQAFGQVLHTILSTIGYDLEALPTTFS